MDNQQLRKVIKSYLAGEASGREQLLVEEWMRGVGQSNPDRGELEARRQVVLSRLKAQLHSDNNGDTGRLLRMKKRTWLVAAAVAVIAGLFTTWMLRYRPQDNREGLISRVEAGPFSVKEIVLPDSSVVVLNSLSSISYPVRFKGDRREVAVSGRAYFKVRTRPEQPFVVKSDSMTVKVLGTSFLVSNQRGVRLASVGVTSGKVAVKYDREDFPEIVLTPGRELQFDKEDEKIAVVNNAKLETAWTTKRLIFDAAPLSDVFGAVGTSYGVSIQYEASKLKGKAFTGSFDKKDALADVLKVISLSYRLAIQRNKDGSLTIR